jgi:hypothetical protein
MSELLLVARCGLAIVFAIAAIAKLADIGGFRRTLVEFGVPPGASRAGAVGIPLAELAVAALLVPTSTARIGAIAAVILLAAFCLGIARVLRRGEQPDCNCFGNAHSKPVGPWTLARNAGLAGAAALVALAGPGAAIGEAALAAGLAAAIAFQVWFSWQLFKQHGRLIARVSALEARAQHQPSSLPVIHRHRLRPGSTERRVRALEG